MLENPLLLTEFGKSWKYNSFSSNERDALFDDVYFKIYSSAKCGGPAAGGLFWQLLTKGMDNFQDGHEIVHCDSPSTANVIAQQSHKFHLIQKTFARMREWSGIGEQGPLEGHIGGVKEQGEPQWKLIAGCKNS